MQMRPLLIAFRLKMSPKEPAMTRGIPADLIAVAACSREEPVPKLYPETRMTFDLDEEEEGTGGVDVEEERSLRTMEAKEGS